MGSLLLFGLLAAYLSLVWISGATSILSRQSLGIDPKDLSYYKANVINCKDGSKKFRKELLNDGFCDCPDGTDEPGTSACPEGKFYCQNAGHISLKIFSSRVNDRICDCCDGSDEYDSNANCTNTCWEAGMAAREKLREKIKTYREGAFARKKVVEMAKQAFVKDKEGLAKLKISEKMLKYLVSKLQEQKERVEKVEEEERLEKEKEENRLKEEENKIMDQEKKEDEKEFNADDNNEAHIREHHDILMPSDSSEIGEFSSEKEKLSSDIGELSREELGRLVASRWTGKDASLKTDKIEDFGEDQKGQNPSVTQEHVYSSINEDDTDKYNHDGDFDDDDDDDDYDDDDDDDEDEDEDAYKKGQTRSDGFYFPEENMRPEIEGYVDFKELDRIQETAQTVLQTYNYFVTPVNVSAAHIRKDFDDISSILSKLQSKLSRLNSKLKHDFGKEKEFYFLHDKCFENKQNKYLYKMCPFKKASQVEGHMTTRLGRWEKFEEPYKVMIFSNGESCWNGPDRSLKVRLRCGLNAEFSDVDEPSRCEYVALMSTPSACLEDELKELEEKLEQMNMEQSTHYHDEL